MYSLNKIFKCNLLPGFKADIKMVELSLWIKSTKREKKEEFKCSENPFEGFLRGYDTPNCGV